MKSEKKSKNKIATWDKLLDKKYGLSGTTGRTEFEIKSLAFISCEMIRTKGVKSKYQGNNINYG